MKKNIFAVLGGLLAFILLLCGTRPTVPRSTLLFSSLEADALGALTCFYTTPSADPIRPFALDIEGFHSISTKYTFYTEGFIPTHLYDLINRALAETPYADQYFHDYLLLDDVVIVAFPGHLSDVFIIDLTTCQAYPLHFTPEQDLGLMYVSHMRLVNDTLIIAAGKAQALTSFIYTVDLPTATVVHSRALPTSVHTLYEQDFTILPSGTCVFILEDALCLYDPLSDTCLRQPLDFTPTQVMSYGNVPLLFREEAGRLTATTPDWETSLTLELPLNAYYLVDTVIHHHNTLLTLVLFDPYGTRFSHYICTYHLPDGKWLDARGLTPFHDCVLHTLQANL